MLSSEEVKEVIEDLNLHCTLYAKDKTNALLWLRRIKNGLLANGLSIFNNRWIVGAASSRVCFILIELTGYAYNIYLRVEFSDTKEGVIFS